MLPFIKKHKTVVTVHDLTPLVFPNHFPAGIRGNASYQIQRHLLRNVEGIVTDSQRSKDDIAKIVGLPEEKIDVAYLAAGEIFHRYKMSDVRCQSIKEKYKLPEKFVLYVGDVTWNKNLPRLMDAMREINLTLVMVGKNLVNNNYDRTNPWNKDLVEVQKIADEDKRFIRLGFVSDEDLVTLYNAATVFVMPSIYEGFGLPVLEAMQSGCPVVTTKGGSLAEVAGDAAYIVDEHDASSIANGIGEVYFNKPIQEKFRKKGLEHAKYFSWKKTAEKTLMAYKKAMRV